MKCNEINLTNENITKQKKKKKEANKINKNIPATRAFIVSLLWFDARWEFEEEKA